MLPPGDDIDEPLSAPPEGCLSSMDVERAIVADAAKVARLIAATRKHAKNDYHWANTVAKLYDTKVKLLRAAGEAARAREHEEIVTRREKRLREMNGPGVSH